MSKYSTMALTEPGRPCTFSFQMGKTEKEASVLSPDTNFYHGDRTMTPQSCAPHRAQDGEFVDSAGGIWNRCHPRHLRKAKHYSLGREFHSM